METKVTGCTDCPLFDATGMEYHVYCHHPKRKFDVEFTVLNDKGEHTKVPVLDSEKEYYDNEVKRWNLLSREDQDKEYIKTGWNSISIQNEPIEDDENYNPITPDWCPLKLEPITITLTPPTE